MNCIRKLAKFLIKELTEFLTGVNNNYTELKFIGT